MLLQAQGSPRDYALLCVFAFTGLRVASVCNADVSDLQTEAGHHVLLTVGKGGKRNRSALNPRTVAALAAYLDGRTEGPLFLTGEGGRLNRNSADRVIKRLAKAAGVSHRVSPHSMRATFITLARESGVVLEDVQDAVNHADPRQTRAYDRARWSLDRHPGYALGAYMAGAD